MNLRLHHFLPHSRANGPGVRGVIWVQGCSLGCPGCFNSETHAPNGGEMVDVDELVQWIVALGDSIAGITISGGEPLQQRPAVAELLRRVKSETALSVILFTGFTWDEVMKMGVLECWSAGVSDLPEHRSVEAFERSSVKSSQKPSDAILPPRSPAPTPQRSQVLPLTDPPTLHPSNPPPLPAFLNYVDVLIAGRYDGTCRVASGLRGSANKSMHFLTKRHTTAELASVPEAEIVFTPQGEMLFSGIRPLRW